MEKNNLPKGWVKTKFENITISLQAGGTPSTKQMEYYTNGTIPFVKIDDITSSDKYLKTTKTKISQQGLKNSSAWLVPKNFILYTMYASYGIPIINKIPVATSQAIIACQIPQKLISLDFIYYFLKFLRSYIIPKGTTQLNLNASIVKNIEISLPPFNEQKRIVNKIETIFTQINVKQKEIKLLEAKFKSIFNMNSLKNSILKQAFEGKLIPQNPNDESAEILLRKIHKKFKKKLIFDNDNIPNGWQRINISQIVTNPKQDIVDGPFGSNLKAVEYTKHGVPLIRLQNIDRYRFIDKNIRYITKIKAIQLQRHNFQKQDIVITKLGTPVGKACLIPDHMKNGIIVADIVRIRLNHRLISKKFLMYLINSPKLILQFNQHTKGTTRQRVNLKQIREFIITLPPYSEQKRIVDKIELAFNKIDMEQKKIEIFESQLKSISNNLNLLKNSILKQAFVGKLVAQDPNDEPASLLMEKIKENKRQILKIDCINT